MEIENEAHKRGLDAHKFLCWARGLRARILRRLLSHAANKPGTSMPDTHETDISGECDTSMSDKRELCCIFSFPDADTAARNFDFEIVENYGDAYRDSRGKVVHYLHTWDDGNRTLIRCRRCGALFLRQDSEYHDMCHGNDAYYTTLVPVKSRDKALAYNKKYNGDALENKCGGIQMHSHSTGWVWNITKDSGENDRQKAEEEEKEE